MSDRAVTANRRLLLNAIAAFESGATPPGLAIDAQSAAAMTGPLAVDTVAPNDVWQAHWRAREAERRSMSPWARELMAETSHGLPQR